MPEERYHQYFEEMPCYVSVHDRNLRIVEANGQPGAVTYDRDGHVVNVFALDIADGEVQAVRCVVNPDKLRHLARMSELAREPSPETR